MRLCLIVVAVFCIVIGICEADFEKTADNPELLVVTIATEENDAFRQFMRSVKKYGLDVEVFGLGSEWLGGTMRSTGGGQKVNLLKEGLKPYRDSDNLIILFTDSYDVIFTEGKDAILEKFLKFDSRVVFAAEDTCWPDISLAESYPTVKESEKRFLNSGGFIGYSKEIIELVNSRSIENEDDDQLYYTEIYLNLTLRNDLNIKLDTRAEIFQNLNFALGEITLKYKSSHSYLYNIKTGTTPIVVHGNGPIKPEFYRLSNYLADGWAASVGCLSCDEDLLDISTLKTSDYPTVVIALFVEYPTPFIREFFQRVSDLDYPKDKIDVYLHNSVSNHTKDVQQFLDHNAGLYKSVRVISPEDNVGEGHARNWAIDECIEKNCQYLLAVDSVVQITKPSLLKDLITQNRSIVGPMLKRPGKLWSNFWGALNDDSFYSRSEDYMEIIDYEKVGLWNVPHIGNLILIQGHRLPALKDAYTAKRDYDPEMSFCQDARDKKIFMYVTNRDNWGHLVYADEFETSHLNNELYEIFNNQLDWAARYIHPNYSQSLKEGAVIETPCPDVYWFPIFSDAFCDELVAEFENYGQWSSGGNKDPRLAGGYENVPTVDIHTNQIGFERHWLHFIKEYVQPLQEKVFTGYQHNPPHAVMNFIVRYRPDEQPYLRPHHDASTYTINVALNRPDVDFQGGGCRFLRYNCSIIAPKMGWLFMHPGRLTHYHEGLHTTAGTRYIMISFIDP